jgi:ribosome biogenesis GTPase
MAQKTSKGSHTTTSSELLALPDGGYCVDTPGIRSFGIWDLKKEEVIHHFHDLASHDCKFPDCIHLTEPGCAVLKKLEEGKISPLRYGSYQTLLNESMSHGEKKTYD